MGPFGGFYTPFAILMSQGADRFTLELSPFTLHSLHILHTSPFTGAYDDAVEDSSPFTLHSTYFTRRPSQARTMVPARTAHPSLTVV